jgi:hypothetical protein
VYAVRGGRWPAGAFGGKGSFSLAGGVSSYGHFFSLQTPSLLHALMPSRITAPASNWMLCSMSRSLK